MQRWGSTARGTPRFHCRFCHLSGVRQRPDHRDRLWREHFVEWLIQGTRRVSISQRVHLTPRTVGQRFRPYWNALPLPRPVSHAVPILVLDATTVVKQTWVVLIAQDAQRRQPVSWQFAVRESYGAWRGFLQSLAQAGIHPHCVVCDGQKGLLKAIHAVWPETLIQRCLVHVVRQAKAWLTQHPKTPAGQAPARAGAHLICCAHQTPAAPLVARLSKLAPTL